MRSKILLSVIVGAAGLLGSAVAHAQETPAPPPAESAPTPVAAAAAAAVKRMMLGADLGVAIPLGNFADGAGIGIGILPRFEFTVIPKLNLTARLGYVYHLAKNNVKVYEIPVLVGAKYDLTDAFYAGLELGLMHTGVSVDFAGATLSSSTDKFGGTIGAGYRMNNLDFKLGLHFLDFGHAGDSMELMINAGYNFWHG